MCERERKRAEKMKREIEIVFYLFSALFTQLCGILWHMARERKREKDIVWERDR